MAGLFLDARRHRTDLVDHFLRDAHLDVAWTQLLEDALDGLPTTPRLLLCVSPFAAGASVQPGCSFYMGVFNTSVLYGDEDGTAGGTFSFTGVTSTQQHNLLSSVLRIAIYVHFSLVLEQHLLLDCNVVLVFPRPKLPPPSPSVPAVPKTKKTSFIPRILSFFARSPLRRIHTRSLDVPRVITPATFDTALRRFPVPTPPTTPATWSSTLHLLSTHQSLLSTSPGVLFPPPKLIVDLAEKEKRNPGRKLKGDEKAALGSLLGWTPAYEGRGMGKGMVGTVGFLRHQQISVLYSLHHSPATSPSPSSPAYPTCGHPRYHTYHYYSRDDRSLGDTITHLITTAEEERGYGDHWLKVNTDAGEMKTPSEKEKAKEKEKTDKHPPAHAHCQKQRRDHQIRIVHGVMRVCVDFVDDREDERSSKHDDNCEDTRPRIFIWESCGICHVTSRRRKLSYTAW